jgi:S1-C subfamily serine protease
MSTLRLLLWLPCMVWCFVATGCASARPSVIEEEEEEAPQSEPLLAAPMSGRGWFDQAEKRLREATVALIGSEGSYCTGALAERSDVVVTALHCMDEPWKGGRVVLAFSDKSRWLGYLAAYDEESDAAVLQLDAPVALMPLPLADSDRFVGGEPLLFLGKPRYKQKVQYASVLKRDQCPSLPEVEDAVFGTFEGLPGDSGAPLVSEGGIVALVHGGAQCNIAVPAARLKSLVREVLEAEPRYTR